MCTRMRVFVVVILDPCLLVYVCSFPGSSSPSSLSDVFLFFLLLLV